MGKIKKEKKRDELKERKRKRQIKKGIQIRKEDENRVRKK